MIIHNYNKPATVVPTAMCSGYSCDTITLDAKDASYIRRMYKERPEQFKDWLDQFVYRFNSNRMARTYGSYKENDI